MDNLKIFSLLAIVADEKIHPASTTHSQMSDEELKDMEIVQNILSISIGAEHIDDIITDLENSLDAIKEN
ncbi:MAG: PLP-dependent transferase [Sphaerochaetaceae bacterium]|nr:PLP-dependent transferase [Sphaerochaetaceae bacterium]